MAGTTIFIDAPFDPATLEALGPEFVAAYNRAMASAAVRVRVEAKVLMPKDSGELRRRFYVAPRATGIEMVWKAPYASIADLGAAPHQIRPGDPSGYLKFPGTKSFAGRTIYSKLVNHPGYAGRFYRFEVGALALRIMNEELKKEFEKIRIGVAF